MGATQAEGGEYAGLCGVASLKENMEWNADCVLMRIGH